MTTSIEAGPAVTAGPAPSPASSAPRPRLTQRGRTRLEIGILAGPALIVFVTFVILPVVLAAYYSLFNWNGNGPLERFIGIDNYVRALSDPVFQHAIANNFAILGLS